LEDAFAEGCVEVWLTSEDTGAYGRDIGSSMPELMQLLLDVVPDGRMLRVGMTNPPYMLEHLPEIARLLRHPKCYAFLHVPVQSGADHVLGAMRREYTASQFHTVADYLLEHVPNMTLATDIICGFPGETERDHDETLQLVSKYKFPILNISQFYPRQGTPAAKMPRVNTQTVKQRTREVSQLFASYQTNRHLLGTEQQCLVTDVAHDGVSLVAHTKSYVQVLLRHEPSWMGATLRVKITEVDKFFVRGEVIGLLHSAPNAEAAANVCVQRQKQRPVKLSVDRRGGGNQKASTGVARTEEEGEKQKQKQQPPPAGDDCEGGGGCGEACACEGEVRVAAPPVASEPVSSLALPSPPLTRTRVEPSRRERDEAEVASEVCHPTTAGGVASRTTLAAALAAAAVVALVAVASVSMRRAARR
jgi:hypothetical protein